MIDRADVHTLPLPGLERWRMRSALGGRGGQLVHAVRAYCTIEQFGNNGDRAACGLEPRRGWSDTLHLRATCPQCLQALDALRLR